MGDDPEDDGFDFDMPVLPRPSVATRVRPEQLLSSSPVSTGREAALVPDAPEDDLGFLDDGEDEDVAWAAATNGVSLSGTLARRQAQQFGGPVTSPPACSLQPCLCAPWPSVTDATRPAGCCRPCCPVPSPYSPLFPVSTLAVSLISREQACTHEQALPV